MRGDAQTAVASEVQVLRTAIARQAASTELVLRGDRPPAGGSGPALALPGRDELSRQLTALRTRVAKAVSGTDDPRALRAELATLLFFAKTLRADAESWRATLEQALAERERREVTERRERERLAAQEAELARRRDALQVRIDQEAARMARTKQGECRRTVPVITLSEGLTVSSMTVSSRIGPFRSVRLWLVTLDTARHEILVMPG